MKKEHKIGEPFTFKMSNGNVYTIVAVEAKTEPHPYWPDMPTRVSCKNCFFYGRKTVGCAGGYRSEGCCTCRDPKCWIDDRSDKTCIEYHLVNNK